MNKLTKYKFSDLYEMSSGISSKPEQAGHGHPFVSFSTVFNNQFLPHNLLEKMDTSEQERETFSVKKGDIFLTRTSETLDELGISSVATKDIQDATFSGFLKRLRPTQTNLSHHKFMGFYLRSKLFRKAMNNNAIMTLRASFNEDIFSYLELLLPDYVEQKKIGNYLYLLYQKIEINNRINIELDCLAKIIYDYWFLQFDFPDNHGKPYKSSGGMMQYNEILKREIPEHWNVTNLKKNSLSEIIIPKVYEFDGKKIYLSTSDVQENNINFKAQNVTFSHRPSRANMQPVNNSVWFAKMKNTKKVLYVGDYSKEFIDNLILSTGFAGLKCRKNSLEYVWGSINNNRFEFIKDKLCSSTTQEAINNNTMVLIPFLEPTKEVLDKYHASVKNIYMKIYNNQVENMHLSNLSEWLLPMLMNGQVKIK